MQNNLIDKKIVDQKLAACGISDMEDATIRDIVKVVNMVEAEKRGKIHPYGNGRSRTCPF